MHTSRFRTNIWILLTWAAIALPQFPVPLTAQVFPFQDSWRWAHFTTESGLPSDQVFCIAETPDGTIWAGTQKGLAWFDGYLWHSQDNRHGIPADQISVIEPYGRDSVFCVIRGTLYVGGKDRFRLLLSLASRPEFIQSVVLTNRNEILALGGNGLFILNSAGVRAIPAPARPMSEGPRNLWRTPSGNIWLNTIRGLYRGDGRVWSLVIPSGGYTPRIQNVVEDRKGNGIAAVSSPREIHGIREWSRGGRARTSES